MRTNRKSCKEDRQAVAHEILISGKKASLKEQNVTYARMLSGYAYSTFLTMLDRRAAKEGVSLYSLNPAFTSVIGTMNYMSRCGITPHEAAAFVIADARNDIPSCLRQPEPPPLYLEGIEGSTSGNSGAG
jgi:hypothetical protein